jgi:hypothetical protein
MSSNARLIVVARFGLLLAGSTSKFDLEFREGVPGTENTSRGVSVIR